MKDRRPTGRGSREGCCTLLPLDGPKPKRRMEGKISFSSIFPFRWPERRYRGGGIRQDILSLSFFWSRSPQLYTTFDLPTSLALGGRTPTGTRDYLTEWHSKMCSFEKLVRWLSLLQSARKTFRVPHPKRPFVTTTQRLGCHPVHLFGPPPLPIFAFVT